MKGLTMKQTTYLIFAGVALFLASCSRAPTDTNDPYADPGTTPPATITDPTVHPAMSLSTPDSDDLVTINVAGMVARDSTALSTAQLRDMFTVVEDGVVKGITVDEIGDGTRAGADIAFVFDTTGSMAAQINGVKESIIEFANYLDVSGLDVQLGSITFGDAFDTVVADSSSSGVSLSGSVPPSFDRSERPSLQLTTDVTAFQAFIEEQRAVGGNQTPENALGALAYAHEAMNWRAGAQCILVVITDAVAWSNVSPGDGIPADSMWTPPAAADTLADLRGDCVVHVISPVFSTIPEAHHDMASFTGVDGTGGVFVERDRYETDPLDLTALPIGDVLASGYVVRYRGTVDGTEHTVRLVVDDGAAMRGETTRIATY